METILLVVAIVVAILFFVPGIFDRRCPHCSKLIKSSAVVCANCGRDLPKNYWIFERGYWRQPELPADDARLSVSQSDETSAADKPDRGAARIVQLNFDRLTMRQKQVIEETNDWANDLIKRHGFKLDAKPPTTGGFEFTVSLAQDDPIWARLSAYVNVVIGQDVNDQRFLDQEFSQVGIDCAVDDPSSPDDDAYSDGMEGPLNLTTLHLAKRKMARSISRLKKESN